MKKFVNFIELLDDFSEMKMNQKIKQKLNFNAIFNRFSDVKEKTKLITKVTSSDLNVFNILKTSELLHSKIIGDFLNPKGVHGQGKLFLINFLEKLGIEKPNDGNWRITVERGNIDILLKRNVPKSIIIIENKSDWAVDQNNQLYRYWYQEMYKEVKQSDTVFWSENKSKYRILYLAPDVGKVPSENSLSRPLLFSSKLPDKLPIEFDKWGFNNHIVKWLEDCLNELPQENQRIKEYVKQYIEFWN
jgi:hypothetical protein